VLTVATWNVNSVKSRLPHLTAWLRSDKPDIVLLQELKCVEEAFPAMEIEELGYNLAIFGEKTYNGVAILSKFPLSDITRGLPGEDTDTHARYIEAVATLPGKAIRVASVYVPNGQEATSDKFQYKLRFLDRLYAYIQTLRQYDEMLVIGGDYNIAPADEDVHNPKLWEGSVLTHDEVRIRLRKILNIGMYDAQKLLNKNVGQYSWWDYRANSFANDDGLRIDHLLMSPQAADCLCDCKVIKALRGMEKASDHAPVLLSLN
jgi:exodeoxyribonuclease-3